MRLDKRRFEVTKFKIVVTKSKKIPNILAWMSHLKVKGGPFAANLQKIEVFHIKLGIIGPVSEREVPNLLI